MIPQIYSDSTCILGPVYVPLWTTAPGCSHSVSIVLYCIISMSLFLYAWHYMHA